MAETVTDALYTKCPLPPEPGHIRLLRLHLSLDHSAPLSGTIFATTFEASRASYEALSYCWGDDARPETITLHVGTEEPHDVQSDPNEHPIAVGIPITRSLAEALADVRFQSSDRLLWADALCINQAHNGEKSIQVRQMYDVYANSRRTLVYLGRDDAEGMQAAIAHRDYLRALNAGSEESVGSLQAVDMGSLVTWDPAVGVVRAGKGSMTTGPGEPDCLDYRTVATLPDTEDDVLFEHDLVVDSWRSVLERPWTTRAWTTQEFVAGPDVLIQLGQGQVTLTLRDLSNLARRIGYEPDSDDVLSGDLHYYGPLCADDVVASKVLRMIRIRAHMSDEDLDIGGVLLRITSHSRVDVLKTRDARDVLWSLLALSRYSASAPELQPNYDLSIDEVYWRFSVHVAKTNFETFLSLPLQMQTGTPSWRLARAFDVYESRRHYYHQWSSDNWNSVTPNEQGTELTIAGVLVDRIDRLIKSNDEVDAQWSEYSVDCVPLAVTTIYNNLQEAASWPGVFTLPGELPSEVAFKLYRGITPYVIPDISDQTGHSSQPGFNSDWDQYAHLYFVAILDEDQRRRRGHPTRPKGMPGLHSLNSPDNLDPTNSDFIKLVRNKGWPMDMVHYYHPPDPGEPPLFPPPEDLTADAVCLRALYIFSDTAMKHSVSSSLQHWRGKTVGMTSRGHLCNVDKEARVGDWIAATANSRYPIILRKYPSGGQWAYTLVGRAYAHGLIEGMDIFGCVEGDIRLC